MRIQSVIDVCSAYCYYVISTHSELLNEHDIMLHSFHINFTAHITALNTKQAVKPGEINFST